MSGNKDLVAGYAHWSEVQLPMAPQPAERQDSHV